MRLTAVLETVLYADDLEAAEHFYASVLGLTVKGRKPGLFVFLALERQMLLIFEPKAARQARDVPAHGAVGQGHVCFAVAEAELNRWAAHLTGAGIAIEQWHDWPDGRRSCYFRDPAGNSLELASPGIWGLSDSLSTGDQAG